MKCQTPKEEPKAIKIRRVPRGKSMIIRKTRKKTKKNTIKSRKPNQIYIKNKKKQDKTMFRTNIY